jgi:hypothetical protein
VTAAAAPRHPRRSRQRTQRDSVQYSCKTQSSVRTGRRRCT